MTSFRALAIPDVIEIKPVRFGDERGYFCEVFKRAEYLAHGIDIDWVQDNQSFSAPAATVRGLHFQAPPFAQHKLVRVIGGAILDVAVDIRKGSPSYGQWVSCELSATKGNQLLVPIGFAHGFMTLMPDTEVLYKVSAPYAPSSEGAILWNDPALAIDWPELGVAPVLSAKDRLAPPLAECASPFLFES